MLKKFVVLFIILIALLANVSSVLAVQAPVLIYVNTSYEGPEDGTQEKPYNTIAEADAVGQTKAGGAVIMLWNGNVYVSDHFVDPVRPGATGIPLAGPVLYGLLAVLSLLLILAGWQLRRRSRKLQPS